MTGREHPRRRRLLGRRPPAVHRPQRPAPVSPEEVLERSPEATVPDCSSCGHPHVLDTICARVGCPCQNWTAPADDVSRETWAELEAALEVPESQAVSELGRYVAGGQVPGLEQMQAAVEASPEEVAALQSLAEDLAPPPPLRRDQILRLEALTAQWERQVRLEDPADATLLYGAPRSLPPVPPAGRVEAGIRRAVDAGLEAAAAPPATMESPAPSSVPPAAEPARASAWSSRHDPRSLEFALRDRLRHPAPLQDVLLEHGPILDQGTTPPLSLRDAAACTGMAAVAARNVLDLRAARGDSRAEYGPRDERDALEVYHAAQELDHVHGHDAPGTSVLAVMQAGQESGWWDTYLWALGGTRDIAQALLQFRAPVVIGIPWPAGMEDPDAVGVVTPTGAAGMGHALCVVGVQRSHAARPGPWFVLQQSRGPAEGDGGLIYLHHTHLAQLLRGVGEAAVPLPRGL